MDSRAEELFERLQNDGEAAIDEFIAEATSEELFLDFKRVTQDGDAERLNNKDRANYAKAVCGFGNSEGGVILWGVDCRDGDDGADVAQAKFPITNPSRYKSWLEAATSGVVIPVHSKVRHAVINSDNETGFVATLVPKSEHLPHQTVGDLRYLMRAGSSFIPVPHAVLSGMFGRTPQPRVWHHWVFPPPEPLGKDRVRITAGLNIHNAGPGIAEHVFANITVHDQPSPNCQLSFDPPNDQMWHYIFDFGRVFSVIAQDGIRIPPAMWLRPTQMSFTLHRDMVGDLRFGGMCGAANSEPWPIEMEISKATWKPALEAFFGKLDQGMQLTDAGKILIDPMFGPYEEGLK